jgi:oligopeptide/dipeptide ABC transporter ATP-binding protein
VSRLEISDLSVSFDLPDGRTSQAVRGIDLAIGVGERVGLIGESGCGKTTTMMAIMGLLPPTATVSGQVRLDGVDLLPGGEKGIRTTRWRDIAMIFQGSMNSFNPVRTLGWQIAEPMLRHATATKPAARVRTRELLELVGLSDGVGSRFPHELSGGMRQRAAIAMALACQPQVLLADEPTTALDVVVQAQILDLLVRLSDELGLSLLLVTHDLGVVAQSCERAAVMYAGRVVESGTMDDLYHQPGHPYTRALFAATPDLYGTETPVSIPGAPPSLDQKLDHCAFAPRCAHVVDRCRREVPELRSIGDGRLAACHLVDQLAGLHRAAT